MSRHKFTMLLFNADIGDSRLPDELLLAGCNDALLHSKEDKTYLTFDREASSMRQAIRHAKFQLRKIGIHSVCEEREVK